MTSMSAVKPQLFSWASIVTASLGRACARSAAVRCYSAGGTTEQPRPPLPPFTRETALQKVQMAEDAWNTKDPEKVAMAYTPDSVWRNRGEKFQGRDAIKAFLARKWAKEINYRLKKHLWSFTDNKIAVRFEYEWWNEEAHTWTRSYGVELWDFAPDGRMAQRHASINDVPIKADELYLADKALSK